MNKKSEIQIFLAHASDDKPAVLALYNRLKQAGYKPWLDKKDLIAGQIWRDEIPKAIKASQIFLACLSAKSANKQGYIQRELRIALDILGEMLPGTIFFIPMRLEEWEIPDLRLAQVGLNLRDIHRLDYWEEDGFEQLERAITHQFKLEPEEPKQSGIVPEDPKQPVIVPEEPKQSVIVTQPLSVFNFEIVEVNAKGEQIKKESKQSQYFGEDLGNDITLEMVAIPGGTFTMGSPAGEGHDSEKPQHQVTVPPFFMGKYPITQAQWQAIASRADLKIKQDLEPKPAYFKDRPDSDRRPVEQVSWYDAIEFCARLSKLSKLRGREYRLPSEAEWEYACRAGTTTAFHFGETITTDLANYRGTDWEIGTKVYPGNYGRGPKGIYREETTPVGYFKVANAFGLYDMHGNVWEWCLDPWHDNYQGEPPRDGSVWDEDNNDNRYQSLLISTKKLLTDKRDCVLRGGSWINYPYSCRSAIRSWFSPDIHYINFGFRVACVSPGL
ncbi:MAG: TIR domain-containing protein [Microcystis viridis Mv_BB_P_19951000_S69]|uniref:TIR domain-containing protein n=1 Tax=Microcystis viridis Mv_BB_P_19951000_S68D TaxID=2486270 RepID=A0A552I6V0_MICVR|nr:MAG: TIR domain-containing protein [Microcystis viridis Mv_BB_P_19951000_S69]TRU75298.1 MAG: TIR domain-containing protein [Microcystis viridis Mv_BB_P_19951000_S68]TRU79214.1 MAG: TIR domain-containing protein [Microcystis viridis Mv_BB_P_19951000_S68D]TRU82105.1 MAG: TIR domain-containing protein [Microcystis viridis Mv_BB_P_19951000_S69D]